jgi:hypothetical protein
VDDALLHAPTEVELLVKLCIVLNACRAGNLTLSRDKVCWGQEISFAGYIIGDKGVFSDPKKTIGSSQVPRADRFDFSKRFSRASKSSRTLFARFGTSQSRSETITQEIP